MATSLSNRLSPERYRSVTWWALLAICGIVVTGAAVRLTGSGLGCTNWPKCNENITPEWQFHDSVEFINRMITGAVSLAVILAVLGSWARRPRRRDLLWWSLGLVGGVLAQIVWGGVTVLSHLNPAVVSGHFLISMLLVWNAVVLHHRAGLADDEPAPRPPPAARLATATAAWGAIALVTGTLVTGTGPHAGDATNPLVTRFDFDLLTIARVHSAFMWVFVALITATAVAVHRVPGPERTRKVARSLLVVAVAQGAVGYAQYFTGVPAWLVELHVLGATVVWALAVRVSLETRRAAAEEPAVVPHATTSALGAAS